MRLYMSEGKQYVSFVIPGRKPTNYIQSSANQNRYCANSVDPDEPARNEPSRQDIHCLLFYLFYYIILT